MSAVVEQADEMYDPVEQAEEHAVSVSPFEQKYPLPHAEQAVLVVVVQAVEIKFPAPHVVVQADSLIPLGQ